MYQRALASMTNPLLITPGLNNYKDWNEYDALILLITYMHLLKKTQQNTSIHVRMQPFLRASQ